MPIHDYRCEDCGRVWEVLHLAGRGEPARCPACGGERAFRMPSAGRVLRSRASQGQACCGRAECCDKSPCSADGNCVRG